MLRGRDSIETFGGAPVAWMLPPSVLGVAERDHGRIHKSRPSSGAYGSAEGYQAAVATSLNLIIEMAEAHDEPVCFTT
jgi:hypothetical protein